MHAVGVLEASMEGKEEVIGGEDGIRHIRRDICASLSQPDSTFYPSASSCTVMK